MAAGDGWWLKINESHWGACGYRRECSSLTKSQACKTRGGYNTKVPLNMSAIQHLNGLSTGLGGGVKSSGEEEMLECKIFS